MTLENFIEKLDAAFYLKPDLVSLVLDEFEAKEKIVDWDASWERIKKIKSSKMIDFPLIASEIVFKDEDIRIDEVKKDILSNVNVLRSLIKNNVKVGEIISIALWRESIGCISISAHDLYSALSKLPECPEKELLLKHKENFDMKADAYKDIDKSKGIKYFLEEIKKIGG